ncbi:MAG: TrkA family potassium uptake protein [Anaerolineae bacterium]|nr:TrkA family potassium uptake protein [Anaerolineae bacterium]
MPSTRLVLPAGRRRRTRWIRSIRAVYRDSLALWREFRGPLLAFLIVVFGGGLLYGELRVLAGYPREAYLNLPYYILRMMILEPPSDTPPAEPYLIVFWYLMPIVAIFIVGRGAADFVRLFFDRSERRNAWEEAVASTYRNHVIILGVGHVGLRVTRTLVGMGFDVVAIDSKIKPDVDDELAQLGVPIIVADGRDPSSLEKAGLPQAQAFIACTSSDQTNLEVIMRARDMNPDIRIVARMWDDQYAKQMKQFMGVQAVLSASDLAAPVFAGSAVGIEITQTLHINGVDYSMIRLHVEPGSFLDGGTVGELQEANDMDIVLHGRDGAVEVQPHNTTQVKGGDTLVIFARHDRVINIVERNRSVTKK